MDAQEEILKLKEHRFDVVDSGDSTVILDNDAEEYFAANPAGSLLWKRLKDGSTREGLVGSLVETFEIDQSRAEADVDAYLARLGELNLLEVGEP